MYGVHLQAKTTDAMTHCITFQATLSPMQVTLENVALKNEGVQVNTYRIQVMSTITICGLRQSQ